MVIREKALVREMKEAYKLEKVSLISDTIYAMDQVSRVFVLTAPQIPEEKMLLLAQQEWATVT